MSGPPFYHLINHPSYFFGGLLDLLSDLDLRLAGLSRPREPDLNNQMKNILTKTRILQQTHLDLDRDRRFGGDFERDFGLAASFRPLSATAPLSAVPFSSFLAGSRLSASRLSPPGNAGEEHFKTL